MAGRAQSIRRSVEAVMNGSSTRMNVLEDCARFALPREQDLLYRAGKDEGGEKPQPVSSEMVNAVDRLVSFIYSNTVGTLSDLFVLRDMDEKRNEISTVTKWYGKVSEVLIKLLQSSNFSLTSHEMLYGYCAAGQGFHSIEMDELTGRLINRAYSPFAGNWMTVDVEGRPNGFYRKLELSARQAVDKFGADKLSERIQKDASNPDTEHTMHVFYYRVARRQHRQRELKVYQGMEWEGVWVEAASDKDLIVDEKGFMTFPFQCPRFYVVDGETHGRGVVHKAMYDIRALQRARYDYFEGIETAIKPPIVTSDEDAADTFDFRAGSVNLVEDVTQIKEVMAAKNIMAIKDLYEDLKQCVRSAAYLDLIQIIERDKVYQNPQTMYLIEQQISGMMPVSSRLKTEFFEPYVVRVLDLVIERDRGLHPDQRMLPEPPEAVLRADGSLLYTVAFNMRLDTKIKQVQNTALLTFLGQAVEVTKAYELNPELDALIPKGKALRYLAENNNVDTDLVNTEEQEKKAKEAQAQAMEQTQQAQIAQQMVKPVDPLKAPEPGSVAEGMKNG